MYGMIAINMEHCLLTIIIGLLSVAVALLIWMLAKARKTQRQLEQKIEHLKIETSRIIAVQIQGALMQKLNLFRLNSSTCPIIYLLLIILSSIISIKS